MSDQKSALSQADQWTAHCQFFLIFLWIGKVFDETLELLLNAKLTKKVLYQILE